MALPVRGALPQAGRDQFFLRTELLVERRLGDIGLLGDAWMPSA
jgi:hypothetical protein